MTAVFQIATDDPEEFQAHMEPIVGPNRVRPARGKQFDISVKAAKLGTLSLFTVKSSSLMVGQEPPLHDYALNIPLGTAFSVTDSNRKPRFTDDAHLRLPERPFHFEASRDCRVLVAGVEQVQFADYASRLDGARRPFKSAPAERVPLSTPEGYALVRGLAALWSDLHRDDPALASAIGFAEREDALVTRYVLATQGIEEGDAAYHERIGTANITRAEEYLLAHLDRPVTRAELAAASGASIRTLSRHFVKRRGTGPMGFLRAQRLNAAYRELLGSAAGETTVTRVANQYGFTQLGKFAGEYKRLFNESPSVTLRH